jgi:hypothetical protein
MANFDRKFLHPGYSSAVQDRNLQSQAHRGQRAKGNEKIVERGYGTFLGKLRRSRQKSSGSRDSVNRSQRCTATTN